MTSTLLLFLLTTGLSDDGQYHAADDGQYRAAAESRPEVWLISTEGCRWCTIAQDAINKRDAENPLPFRIVVKHGTPYWLNNDVTSYPTFYWSSVGTTPHAGECKQVAGWKGVDSLVATWGETRKARRRVPARIQTSHANYVANTEEPTGSPTPIDEVERVIGLLPQPQVGFVEFGCGSDARWCVAAVRRWGCRATGIEIDPERAETARDYVRGIGLDSLITIINADATTVDVQADVGAAYLYEDTLGKLRPRAEKLRAFASYIHQPPGLSVVKNGDSWIYTKPTVQTTQMTYRSAPQAVWGGRVYSQPVCSNPNCGMCNSIRAQLNQQNWR